MFSPEFMKFLVNYNVSNEKNYKEETQTNPEKETSISYRFAKFASIPLELDKKLN